ncbi:hypothetical protein FT641_18190 [Bacillus paranthracis]|uniref:hypothetical protein n=1 Tax=Bacillus paranthracis TaxID=2026186 RepID=UPI001879CB3C|nr:hypothetical protein [Bacillus paranthracis]MBE7114507.1 hypothetical protein [Bacillus paranthracis]MBE7154619.1 hypothetical protein [Bacillus paranthracis]
MNLWDGTFRIDLVVKSLGDVQRKTVIHKGSLKSAIRKVLKDYKDTYVVANFSTVNGLWLKEISM